MKTLKQFLRNIGKNEPEAEKLTRSLMEWMRVSKVESQDSYDDIRLKLADVTRPFEKPSDLQSFFTSDNPPYGHFRAVMCALELRASQMYRIILGLPAK